MKKQLPNLTYVGFVLALAYWMLESALHAYVFGDGSLRQTLLAEHDPNELWMRVLVVVLLTAFGWASERYVRAERHEKERAIKLNRLFNYIHHVGQLMSDTNHRQPIHASEIAENQLDSGLLDENEIGRIVHAVQDMSRFLDTRVEELYALLELTHEINKGLLVDEVLDKVYESFRSVIPYNRIGVALLRENGNVLTSRWFRSDSGESQLPMGFSAPMAGSSLQRIIETGEPRIINDLAAYVAEHPQSKSSRMILEEGIHSSMTCPLIVSGKAIGFIFFSSRETGTYRDIHSDVFRLIAGQLSMVIEKSHTYQLLLEEKETSDALLLNVMPARIISRIRGGNNNPVEELPEVGVLFVDIVAFTEIARQHAAESVVQFLQEVFSKFDDLCEKHRVEKIKTIGDAYMVYAGGEASDESYIANLARFALDVIAAAQTIVCPNGNPLRVRIGLHAGPVIAGV
ncbi:MAG: GAF domain-containing protein, partial [Candidatus Hydrogenedentes bacterium]|nr:GAF domain-containing protein [Candidatus Hydrogenedentota bacterium]